MGEEPCDVTNIDVDIYERVFGGRVVFSGGVPFMGENPTCRIPSPSTRLDDAIEVVNKIVSDNRSIGFRLESLPGDYEWHALFGEVAEGVSPSLQRAICLAALSYVKVVANG